jgi:predicted phosphohydrolase
MSFCILSSCTKTFIERDSNINTRDTTDGKASDNFSPDYLVVFGDIQEYTASKEAMEYYTKSVNWIESNLFNADTIKCVLQVGDITWTNTKFQWDLFYDSTNSLADKIPYIACIGNHDYTWDSNSQINDRNSTLFSNYTSFNLTKKYIVSYFEESKMDNIIARIPISGKQLYIISLEFGPRKEVIEWANKFVQMHPSYKFILMTHEFLTGDGIRISSNSYAERQLRNTSYSTPEEIWNNLIKYNDNIICVLCGHNGFVKYVTDKNAFGDNVPQILFNLQYQDNGGDGLVQLWEFPYDKNEIHISVFNTITQHYLTDPSTSFVFDY